MSLENLKNNTELDKFNKIQNRKHPQTRGFPSQDTTEDSLKKSPSTPNLNWRYAVTEDSVLVSGQEKEVVVKRRPKKVQRTRPRSEFRERNQEETWIDGERSRRPRSYIDLDRGEKDYYIQTCRKPVAQEPYRWTGGSNLPSLPRPLLSGLVWHQTSGLFSRWKEVFLILTKDCLRCHKISGSAKTAQFGGLLWSLDLVLMSDVRFVERRGYLTLCLEAQGITRTYLRRTDGIRNPNHQRDWGDLIMKSVKRKKDEFERDMSPSDLLRYPRPLLQLQPDSWLLSRLSPHTNPGTQQHQQHHQQHQQQQHHPPHHETEHDSGLDSLNEESDKLQSSDREKLIGVDEMQEVKLNLRGAKCYNLSSRVGNRPKIPTRLCKVTRV